MATFIKIEKGRVVNRIDATQKHINTLPDRDKWKKDSIAQIGFETQDEGVTFSEPQPKRRMTLTFFEWVELFTDREWRIIKRKRNEDNAQGEKLDKLLDELQQSDSVNIESGKLDQFYTWLSNQGLQDQKRIDELKQGILERK